MSRFVDDTKLCHRPRNRDDITELQEDINELIDWANKWISMLIYTLWCTSDTSTCKVTMTYSIKSFRQQIGIYNYIYIYNKPLFPNSSSSKTNRKATKTANRVMGFIVSYFRYKNKELILALYKSLVRPHLEHAVQFWAHILDETLLK